MMKITLFALAALAVVCAQDAEPAAAAAPPAPPAPPAAPAAPHAPVEIVKQVEEVDINKYNFEYETSDGTSRQETGEYKNDTDQQGLVVKGSYKYVAPDGQKISVSFIADKNGYQPTEDNGDKDQNAAPAPEA